MNFKNMASRSCLSKKIMLVCSRLAVCLGLFMALPTRAASLQLVTDDWGTNGVPTNVTMYAYVPDNLAPNPPILVLLHYWGGGAAGVFAAPPISLPTSRTASWSHSSCALFRAI